jgi:hypothetical protein
MTFCIENHVCSLMACFGAAVSVARPGDLTRVDCGVDFAPELTPVFSGMAFVDADSASCELKILFCPDKNSPHYFSPELGDLVEFKGRNFEIKTQNCQIIGGVEWIESLAQ